MTSDQAPGQLDWVETVGKLNPQQGLHGTDEVTLCNFSLLQHTLPHQLHLLLQATFLQSVYHRRKFSDNSINHTINMDWISNKVLHDFVQLFMFILNKRRFQECYNRRQ